MDTLQTEEFSVEAIQKLKDRALFEAVSGGKLAAVHQLIEHGANVHSKGPGRETLLVSAVQADSILVFQALLDAGKKMPDISFIQYLFQLGRTDLLDVFLSKCEQNCTSYCSRNGRLETRKYPTGERSKCACLHGFRTDSVQCAVHSSSGKRPQGSVYPTAVAF